MEGGRDVVKPRVRIMRVSGTNCDRETEWAFTVAGGRAERVHINECIAGRKRITDYQVIVIPGGFSYGDDIAAGKVFANELRYKLWDAFEQCIARGKPILGICNGFQVLVKSGVLPRRSSQCVTLGWNDSGRYEDRWVHLRVEQSVCPFTRNLPAVIRLPVAHAEGKFIPRNGQVLEELEKGGRIVLRYVSPAGELKGYPHNPNGSTGNVAAICDESGLILGMMPHPERCLLGYHYPDWGRMEDRGEFGVGFQIFRNVIEYVS